MTAKGKVGEAKHATFQGKMGGYGMQMKVEDSKVEAVQDNELTRRCTLG